MSNYEAYSLLIAGAAFVASIIAIIASYRAVNATNKINIKIAQRQNVINLHATWKDTSMLADPVVVPDLVRSVNALSETAAAWNHDINDRYLIDQLYYESFSRIYDFIQSKGEQLVPSLPKSYRDLLTPDIQRAYQGMKEFHLSQVVQTKML